MTSEYSGFNARNARILAVAIAVAFAATACKPAAQNEAAADQQPAVAQPSTPATDTGSPAMPPAANIALHELDEQSRATALTPTGLCSMDGLNDGPLVADKVNTLATPSAAVFVGWVGEKTTNTWPQQPRLRLDQVNGGRAWEVGLGAPVSRKDVAKHFNAESMTMTGFKAPVDLSSLPAGDYTVRVVYDSGTHHMNCDRHTRIHIGS